MEINEKVAVKAFSEDDDECPMAPHVTKGFKGKAKGTKSVADLRKAMVAGQSTRQWKQTDRRIGQEKFEKAQNMDASKQAEPSFGDCITIASVAYPLSIAAHHLIPGEASLPNSSIARFLWASEGEIKFDVGYDVDGSENGVWLPTHQVMSSRMGVAQAYVIHDDENPSSTTGMSWAELSERARDREGSAKSYTELFLPRYTQQAMQLAGCQFHDAHDDYSNWVTDKLNDIDGFIEAKIQLCDKCAGDGKKSPPYILVYRLNSLSKLMRGLLVGPPKKSWLTVYTSEFSAMYVRSPLPTNKLK